METKEAASRFQTLVQQQGVLAGLAFLNDRVGHRFTFINKLDGSCLIPLFMHDKKGRVKIDELGKVELDDSFCQIVFRDGSFSTSNSGEDPRLIGHPYSGTVLSYHGVPLLDNSCGLFGTLCHLDYKEVPLPDDEFELLRQAGNIVSRFVCRTGAGLPSLT